MKNVTWPQVVLVLGMVLFLMTGGVILVILDKDLTIIMSITALLAVPILSALGVAVYQKVDQVKEVSNGALSQALALANQNQVSSQDANAALLTRVLELLEKNHTQLADLALLTNGQVKPQSELAGVG